MRNSTRSSSLSTIVRSCRLRRPRREEEGATLVEFAIILPVFALMLFGMIQFGLAFAGWDELRNAVQTGARMALTNDVSGNPECGQTDAGSNIVCQVALLIGAPVDTTPALVDNLTILPSYGCTSSSTSQLQSCTTGDAWLDGYYIFENGQWLQVVDSNSPLSDQISDTQAFQQGAGTWTCSQPSSSDCASIATNVTGEATDALGSDSLTINVANNQVEVCAQRQVVSFTALPALQAVHLSTTSTFYLALTATSTTVLGCPNQPNGPPCAYQSAGGITCG
jgi:Flp pilus assembly protein TadG